MVNAHELRIGNIVINNDSEIVIIYEICEFTVRVTKPDFWKTETIWGYHINEINPIPLTDEWALKLGFEEIGKSSYFKIYTLPNGIRIALALKVINNDPYATKSGSFYIGENHTEIPTVHWLQNYVYFNYSGFELTLK